MHHVVALEQCHWLTTLRGGFVVCRKHHHEGASHYDTLIGSTVQIGNGKNPFTSRQLDQIQNETNSECSHFANLKI